MSKRKAQPKHADAWLKLLIRRKVKDEIKLVASFHNAAVIIQHELSGLFAWDEFRACVALRAPMPIVEGFELQSGGRGEGALLEEVDVDLVVSYLSKQWNIDVGHGTVAQAITFAARSASYHPVTEWLAGLRWDGVPRLDTWLVDLCEVADSPYARKVGTWFLCGAVNRVCVPGVKHDEMLVLEGPQGAGKSSAFKVLAGEWFSDSPLDLTNKDRFVQLRGNLIVEIAELDGFTKQEVTRVKAFMSSSVDDYRAPYARQNSKVPRQCVFGGTVNENEYLHDATGGRRFYPVRVGRVDLRALAMIREQLWAEAFHRWRTTDGAWKFRPEDYPGAREEQESRRRVDPWEPGIARWVMDAAPPITIQRILLEHLGIDRDRWGRTEETRVGKCLTALGYRSKQVRLHGVHVRVYVPSSRETQGEAQRETREETPPASQPSQPVTTGTPVQGCDASEAWNEGLS